MNGLYSDVKPTSAALSTRGSGRRRVFFRTLAILAAWTGLLHSAPTFAQTAHTGNNGGSVAEDPAAGQIVGRVFDEESGDPLVGGQVVVEKTDLGAVTRGDGSYAIKGVPAGTYMVTSGYLGYQPRTRDLRVGPGQAVTADFALSSEMIDSPEIVATYDRELLARRSEVRPEDLQKALGLPVRAPIKCDSDDILHGAYIDGGRWTDYNSVANMRCVGPGGGPPPPKGVIAREDAELLSEEQKSALAERGYLIRGFNDEDFPRR